MCLRSFSVDTRSQPQVQNTLLLLAVVACSPPPSSDYMQPALALLVRPERFPAKHEAGAFLERRVLFFSRRPPFGGNAATRASIYLSFWACLPCRDPALRTVPANINLQLFLGMAVAAARRGQAGMDMNS